MTINTNIFLIMDIYEFKMRYIHSFEESKIFLRQKASFYAKIYLYKNHCMSVI